MARNIFIENNDPQEHFEAYFNQFNLAKTELISTTEALDRITVRPIYAAVSDPCFNAAAMDGIATIAVQTVSAHQSNPLLLQAGSYCYVNTGDLVPPPFDCVIMIEDISPQEDDALLIIESAHPWQHMRMVGESVVQGEMLLKSQHQIRPMDIGALLSGGVGQIEVYQQLKMGIIPTGAELVTTVEELKPGKLMEYNSHVFSGLASQYGAIAKTYPIVKGEQADLEQMIKKAVDENDLLIINAGSSAGSRDFTAPAIKALGQIHTHGLAIKPGKPTILAQIDHKPVLGVPGYPVSAYLVFEKFVKPFLSAQKRPQIEAKITRNLVSGLKHSEFIRVSLAKIDGEYLATPLERGAASIMSLVKADGLATIERNVEGIEQGQSLAVELMRPLSEIEQTLVFIGSHDLLLDEMADILPIKSSHVGSMGGLMALQKGLCHLAPIHILDEETGLYNRQIVADILGDDYIIIKGVARVQGFICRKDAAYQSFSDLAKPGIAFANRQRGSGTRILLDYHLAQLDIDSSQIYGYDKEYTTHMAVAAAVQSGAADLGLGVYSAAKALDLDFYPCANEEYDFVLKKSDLADLRVQNFIDLLKSERFKEILERLGGYQYAQSGQIDG